MKANIHLEFYEVAIVTCACGYTFTTGSTKKNITVEVCYKCHPFYTGEQKFIDTKGQINAFLRKQKLAQEYHKKVKPKTKEKKEKEERRTKSLSELLSEI